MPSFFSERHFASPITLDETNTELIFQSLKPLTYNRLRASQPVAGAHKMLFFSDGDKRLQAHRFKHPYIIPQ